MRDRASAIIIHNQHLLLIHRIRAGQEYYVFPGGQIEEDESPERACIREVLEETGLHVNWLQSAFDFAMPVKMDHYFFVQVSPGNMKLGGPEALRLSKENQYILEWVPVIHLERINVQPQAVRYALDIVIKQIGLVLETTDLALHRERLKETLLEIDSE